MRKLSFIALCFFLLAGSLNSASDEKRCDRECLVTLMDRYLAALARHDPTSVPLDPGVRFVENTQKTAIGGGLWETISSGPWEFRIYVADPVEGQVGFMGVIQARGKPVILGARLRLARRQNHRDRSLGCG